jgi:MarR family 2-MHQ and catechol resistance regulon transcriptional repressor
MPTSKTAPRKRTARTHAPPVAGTNARSAQESGAAAPIDDPEIATALKLWLTMSRAYQSVNELSRMDVARQQLNPAEFAIMEALYHKGRLLLGDVQRKVLVSSGGTTFLVDRLEKRGLVERQSCPSDRRARYAALTKEGFAMMKKVFPVHAKAMRDAMLGLSTAEQKVVTAYLKRLGLTAAARAAANPACREGIGEV